MGKSKRKNKKKRKKEPNNIEIIFYIVLGFLILFFLVWWWHERQPKTEQEKKERAEWLHHRRARLQKLIDKKKEASERFKKWFRIGYIILKIVLVLSALGYNYFVYKFNLRYSPANITEWIKIFVAWNTGLTIVISALLFLFYRRWMDIKTAISGIKDWIAIKVYGKHFGIEDAIKAKEEELKAIESELNNPQGTNG